MAKKASEKLKEKTAGAKSAKRKVERLARAYRQAQTALDNYHEEYEDILAEFERLAIERNIALDKLKRGCKETKMSAGPFDIIVSQTREFDGGYLYESLDDSIRDEVVEIQYKVKPKMFDKYVQSGHIITKIAQKAVVGTSESPKALNGPKEIVLG